jgi:hypothetical protein
MRFEGKREHLSISLQTGRSKLSRESGLMSNHPPSHSVQVLKLTGEVIRLFWTGLRLI